MTIVSIVRKQLRSHPEFFGNIRLNFSKGRLNGWTTLQSHGREDILVEETDSELKELVSSDTTE